MIVVTGSVTARADSFDEVRKLSLEHVHRSLETLTPPARTLCP